VICNPDSDNATPQSGVIQITRTSENLVIHPRETNQQCETITGMRRVNTMRMTPRWSSLQNQLANHHACGGMIPVGAAALTGLTLLQHF